MSLRKSRYAGHGSVHGVLVIDKPSGPTSHDVVSAARRHFGTRRIGHAGTLDPLATGVLVLLLGEATKLSAYLTRAVKSYVAEIVFGSSTSSLDAQGSITRRVDLASGWLSHAALGEALERERARTLQIPPAVSAIKVDGKRAHARTRQGEALELAPRDVALHEVRLLEWDDRRARLELTVSKGYYVRAFARDLGEALGVPAHLGSLRRTRSGPFSIEDAVAFPPPPSALPLPLSQVARQAFAVATLTAQGAERARAGKLLDAPEDYTIEGSYSLEGTSAAGQLETSQPTPETSQPTPETGREPTVIACLYGDRLVALAQQTGPETLSPKTLKIVRGIHDGGPSDLHAPSAVG